MPKVLPSRQFIKFLKKNHEEHEGHEEKDAAGRKQITEGRNAFTLQVLLSALCIPPPSSVSFVLFVSFVVKINIGHLLSDGIAFSVYYILHS